MAIFLEARMRNSGHKTYGSQKPPTEREEAHGMAFHGPHSDIAAGKPTGLV